MKDIDRRIFIKQATVAGVGLGVSGQLSPVFGVNAPSNRVVVGVVGVAGRGRALADRFAVQQGCEVAYICDVDERAVTRVIGSVDEALAEAGSASGSSRSPQGVTDFRRILDDPAVDAIVIAMPDHWHTPAAILAMEAGKHVYLEKPGSHNPQEAEWVVAAQERYDRVVQLGNQQRSDPRSIEVIRDIHDGLIGRAYYAHTWYANTRGPIGTGQEAEPPEWLDYELWQGPAPRTPYRDNVIHYNWHWLWRWGTGEICNNGAHELDIARWALDVDYPTRVRSNGGRYHYDDDWEAFDTQVANFDFEDEKTITWHGRSCNGMPFHNRGRGTTVHGTEGTVLVDRSGYIVYDLDNNEVRRVTDEEGGDHLDTVGAGGLTDFHIENFLETVRGNTELNSPIDIGQRSMMLCHLGNIAQRTNRGIRCNPRTGRILGDEDAMRLWGRVYQPGWQPRV